MILKCAAPGVATNFHVGIIAIPIMIAIIIPYNVGVFVPKCKSHFGDWYDLKSVKNARRKDRTRPEHDQSPANA